ncbi:phosphate acetyltransferase [Vibrio cincinnatiensis]|uniref:Phosphate acetyltransferase n=1 Tax=Vibrio cincinnatiensis DSM 19608 TaxID=1123491 RepID=A0A1T4L044_VIBCI|nr:phosphate acetyltransferase [Vibrio cincinnatiensis]MCG3722542.1 phosphate acetyltransferase [Vibrio cincinnatiensis]MCG3733101.1 phosphate acetyltransferase [Vibrio cincinnatiensis]MCG3736033.1 phosphate acetyltransferase [Vibrio cincinnatiensis]MCG3739891.1 phosphate acetyltransferase [Vibrio cincinnatiensis]MCG3747771.1 phosphate acetyltransferase [Vibrio cincinnatiensis]
MSRTIMLVPISAGVGLTSVSMGLLRAMERKGVSVSFYKPISQPRSGGDQPDLTSSIISHNSDMKIGEPMPMSTAEALIGGEKMDVLLETVVERYNQIIVDSDVTLVEGLVPTRKHPFANQVNAEIAKTLGAEIVFVATPGTNNPTQLKERIEVACSNFGGTKNKNISGVVINKLNAPVDDAGRTRPDLSEIFDDADSAKQANLEVMQIFNSSPIRVLGCVPWNVDLIATRAIDMAKHLKAEVINEGDINTRRIKSITFCARSIPHMIEHFKPGSLLVTSADRPDVIVAAALAAMNGVEIGAVLLTGGYDMPNEIVNLCKPAFDTGLPIFKAQGNTWQTSLNLQSFSLEVPADDKERIEFVSEHVASHIDGPWIDSLTEGTQATRRLSPPAFRYQLTEFARRANKRIVLPEGDEPRTVKAAAICAERGIARCVLLGNPDEIKRVAALQGVELGAGVEIIDADAVRENYVARLVELRGAKGMTEVVAREKLEDSVFLGTMMLEADEVDGLVSGAVHTTANTIVPPFQIIKTAPNASIVSSVFFMLLPDQVLVYGDCAINPDPTAEQLAEIAIQSADSAAAFGIEPRVAMISYSTGTSGKGADVDKVREATRIAQEKRPDLIIDGPLQYDAAIMENVAASKAPDSPVAGKATVFVFPDLNTGNTTYKAVQRSADLVSIGPMLQGMRKPVNDLSRGALVDDIVYTIALTAIQADQDQK